ncbi:MAG: hypothetical protein A3H98_03275 [Bacteroidetes bacterium RIFCSPLOWO2_02_FULL_36_8]|nr:MAG: hypothetical protein A3H98_03275 [Bacteroidetes bacterium RIFCSPLOWO2_02_FULL_36_8]OFY71374.1 MAG: hypothetical protein A3G23_04270 [Bacteroidetes bacterium RIFCSPLOWO2_12_FULL_37_12]
MNKAIIQIGYSGTGGVADVMVCLAKADKIYKHVLIFYGVEDVPSWIKNECEENKIEFYTIKKGFGLNLFQLKTLSEIVLKLNPLCVLAHGVDHLFFKLFFKNQIPVINLEHQNFIIQHRFWYIKALLLKKNVSAYAFLTDESRINGFRLYPSIFKNKPYFIVSNPIHAEFLVKPVIKNDRNSFISIGRLIETKDLSIVFYAFTSEKTQNARLTVIGDGIMMSTWKKITSFLKINDRIVFKGNIPRRELPAIMQSSFALIHSTEGETLPLVILEAMACGLPVIASDVSGVNNLIEHKRNGLLFKNTTEESLIQCIESLQNDHLLYEHIQTDGVKTAEKYRPENVIKLYQDVFREFER